MFPVHMMAPHLSPAKNLQYSRRKQTETLDHHSVLVHHQKFWSSYWLRQTVSLWQLIFIFMVFAPHADRLLHLSLNSNSFFLFFLVRVHELLLQQQCNIQQPLPFEPLKFRLSVASDGVNVAVLVLLWDVLFSLCSCLSWSAFLAEDRRIISKQTQLRFISKGITDQGGSRSAASVLLLCSALSLLSDFPSSSVPCETLYAVTWSWHVKWIAD